MERKKITPVDIQALKAAGKKITMLTAYDYPMALLEDRAGIDIILVGDSVGMTVLGYENTLPVTMDEMIHHTKAVTRGAKYATHFGRYAFHVLQHLRKGCYPQRRPVYERGERRCSEAGGGSQREGYCEGHCESRHSRHGSLGLTPQTISMLGGFKVQGKDAKAAQKIIDDARMLEDAGAFSVLLEAIPAPIAKRITEQLEGSHDRNWCRHSL